MNFIEYHDTIEKNLPFLDISINYEGANQDKKYLARGLLDFRRAINNLEEVPYINNEIDFIKRSALFSSWDQEIRLDSTESTLIKETLLILNVKLKTFLEIGEQSKLYGSSDTLYIRIPEINSFDDLTKYSNDLKKAIEIPITDKSIDGKVEILSADEGSIIFFIAVGTVAAVKLVAGICWAAAVIKKKRMEANIYEQHIKTLELNNEAIRVVLDAQKIQLNNILDAEANQIANNNYNHNDPETIERLKLSINTVSNLIDKGVKILPLSKDEDVQKQFPDYSNLNLIESSIKQITND